MDAAGVCLEFPSQLAHGFKEWQRLNVADRTADFRNHEVEISGFAKQLDVSLDFVGYVRNNLNGFAKILAVAFFVNYVLINPPRGYVVCAGGAHVREAFIVAEVKVGLMAVDRNITFPVFIRIQSSGVNIDVRVEFLDGDAKAARLKQASE